MLSFWILLGVIVSLSILYLIWPFFVYFFFFIFLSKSRQLKKAGEWAIVTGASEGIGKAFAEQLAKRKLNILLISLPEDKLEIAAEEISKKYNVQTKTFAGDFSNVNMRDTYFNSEIDSLSSISCLVNNVGIAYKYPDAFATADHLNQDFLEKIITINVTTMTKLTRMVLPKMITDPLPVKGAKRFIINMSSISGVITIPYFSVYGATKAYVVSFTRSLAIELKETCVRVQAYTPSLIATSMTGFTKPTAGIPSPTIFVKSALTMLGVQTVCSGYFLHAMRQHILGIFPRCVISPRLGRRMLRARDKQLKKMNTA
ncbi:unnamed protein product [Hymenolepis diminuta]|uniref:Estradiol 17-beta-dehydrogenase 12 n=1 Tax=Hymenolepis diminuta TaxID=6216 RepID=A0A0R3SA36_HYMDI|nr:unnamed protein product [Hymenolepis diminuta]